MLSILREIYQKLPVNLKCIEGKKFRDEMKLAARMAHMLQDVAQDLDESEISDMLKKLLRLVLHKILICYDSETFLKHRLAIYDNLTDENMRNCIVKLANGNASDAGCAELHEEIYEMFEIDVLFLETSNVVGIERTRRGIEECIDMESDKQKRLFEVSRMIVGGRFKSGGSFESRQRFDKFYIDTIRNIVDCIEGRKLSASQIPTNAYHQLILDLSKIFHFFLSLNFIIFVVFLILIAMLFVLSMQSKDHYRYELID